MYGLHRMNPFVILFPLGIMNIAVMALVTVLIYAEKSLPIGRQISQIVGGGLIVYGGTRHVLARRASNGDVTIGL